MGNVIVECPRCGMPMLGTQTLGPQGFIFGDCKCCRSEVNIPVAGGTLFF